MRAVRIGLTGGIGAGKSLALREFGRLGAKVVSSDDMARDVVLPGRPAYKKIIAEFGKSILDAGGRIDRKRLGDMVFASAKMRRDLERITHPIILREMERRIKQAGPHKVVIVDVPLLFEGGHQKRFDATIFVSAPASLRARRVMSRDALGRGEVQRRMSAQWPDKRKAVLADVVMANAGSKKKFLTVVREYHRALTLIAAGAGVHRHG